VKYTQNLEKTQLGRDFTTQNLILIIGK